MTDLKLHRLAFAASVAAVSAMLFSTFVLARHEVGIKSATVLIIRHAEQQDDGVGLSSIGESRAKAYADYFTNFTLEGHHLKINYLFAARDSYNSHRPRLTLEPTAAALALTINTQFKNKQVDELVDALKDLPSGAGVVICWHHGTIPELLDALGADASALLPNGRWPPSVFGWLTELRYDERGLLLESKIIKERLLPND